MNAVYTRGKMLVCRVLTPNVFVQVAMLLMTLVIATSPALGHGGDFGVYAIFGESPHVGVIHLSQPGESTYVELPQGPGNVAFSSDGELAFFPLREARTIVALRTDALRFQATLSPSDETQGDGDGAYFDVAFDSRRGVVWATDADTGRIDLFHLWRREHLGEIEVGKAPGHITMASGSDRVYVFDREEPVVYVIRADERELAGQLELDAPASLVIEGPATEHIYFADAKGRLGALETETGTVGYFAELDDAPNSLAYLLDRGIVVVSSPGKQRLLGIRVEDGASGFEIQLPAAARDVVAAPDGHQLFVALDGSAEVFVVDAESGEIDHRVEISQAPTKLGVQVSERPCE